MLAERAALLGKSRMLQEAKRWAYSMLVFPTFAQLCVPPRHFFLCNRICPLSPFSGRPLSFITSIQSAIHWRCIMSGTQPPATLADQLADGQAALCFAMGDARDGQQEACPSYRV
jgi:hypothetical protein